MTRNFLLWWSLVNEISLPIIFFLFLALHEEFYKAIKENNFDEIQYIIDEDESIVSDKYNNNIPFLFEVVRYCSFEVFLHFVYKRCNIQITNEYSNTILHKAAYYNRPKIIKHVARRRLIDINAQDDLGYTALHHAAYNNNDECCRVLLEFNIDKNITHRSGYTAYDVAIKNGINVLKS